MEALLSRNKIMMRNEFFKYLCNKDICSLAICSKKTKEVIDDGSTFEIILKQQGYSHEYFIENMTLR
jgi:hypothetical protein